MTLHGSGGGADSPGNRVCPAAGVVLDIFKDFYSDAYSDIYSDSVGALMLFQRLQNLAAIKNMTYHGKIKG